MFGAGFSGGGGGGGKALQSGFAFGAVTVVNGTTFLYRSGIAPQNSSTSNLLCGHANVPAAGVLSKLSVRHKNPSGAGSNTYTIMRNGIATAMTVTLATASGFAKVATTLAVSEDDALTIQAVAGASLGLRVQVEFWYASDA